MAESSPSDICLRRAEWQPALFAEEPRRIELLRLRETWPCRPLAVHVFRNQAFEFVASVLRPFLLFAGYAPEVTYGDYDDALTATEARADVIVVWLDFERHRAAFGARELSAWLGERLRAMRRTSGAPILVADWAADDDTARAFNALLRDEAAAVPGARVVPQSELAGRLGDAYRDRRERAMGMRLSDRACIATARELGLGWIPGVLAPRLKAVAVDLDHTLYRGVLGEDGWQALELTEGHRALQDRLRQLRAEGLFVAIVSRNERRDVDELFQQRNDFPLRSEDVSAWAVSWEPKAEGLRRVAEQLRVGLDAVLFIDDNPGELAAVAEALPAVHTLHAQDDPRATLRALERFPRLARLRATEEDALRADDLRAAETREALARDAADPGEYRRSLDIHLEFAMDPAGQAPRIHELSNKTNQFNLALRRMGEVEVAARLAEASSRMVTVRMRDRLSDSGVIALVAASREGDLLRVDEVCISCRALGRGLEDALVAESIRGILSELPAARVEVAHATGPRNAPARDWLARFAAAPLDDAGTLALPTDALAPQALPLTLTWSSHGS